MKTKKYLVFALLLVIGGSFLYGKYEKNVEAKLLEEGKATFNLYLESAKEKDLQAISTLSYQLSEACKDESRREECDTLMISAHSFGIEIEQDALFVLNFDKKQLILVNEYIESLEGPAPAVIRAIIYFVRDGENLKLLSFNPYDGAFIIRSDEATTTLSARLKEMVKDTDKDGLADRVETCSDDTASLLGCVKTDPEKKDTNSNGWWDSIEALFYPDR